MRSVKAWLRQFIVGNFVLVAAALLLFSTSLVIFQLQRFSRELAQCNSVHMAKSYNDAILQLRRIYTSEVCDRLRESDVKISRDYREHDGAIPLPATLSKMLGDQFAGAECETHLYSDFPFLGHGSEGGPQDEFERSALKVLRKNPTKPFARFEKLNGKRTLRYATADVMQSGCVNCHNTHPESPKRDWRVGDVRGVLAISTPVIAESEVVSQGISATLALLGVIFTAVTGLFWFMYRRLRQETERLRQSSSELAQRTDLLATTKAEYEQANKELSVNAVELERSRIAAMNLMQDMREAKDKAESATQMKSRFLANMSHEIRTPMTAILGFADKLHGSLTAATDIESIETIRSSGQHLLSVINNVLDISKIESGTLQLDLRDCSPHSMLMELYHLMQHKAESKGIAWRVSAESPLPEQIMTDPTRLRQILINLVGNALKFTDSGSVALNAYVKVNRKGMRQDLVFEVTDTGIGMHEHEVAAVMKPFVQADSSMSRGHGGTGLGLSISRRFAQMLGGGIEVESEKEVGSQVRLTIAPSWAPTVSWSDKLQDAEQRSASAIEVDHLPLQSLRILAADDSLDNRRLLSFILKKAGADLTLVENGLECKITALDAAASNIPFDLILLDMQMPVMDGYTATRELRALGYRHPIVALTAHAMVDDRDKCIDAGCDEFASKPFNKKQLIKTIFDVVAKSRLAVS